MHLKKQRLCALFIILSVFVSLVGIAAEKSPDDVLAQVDKTKITREMFEKEFQTFLETADERTAAHFNTPEGKKMFLKQISEIYAMEAKADEMGLSKGKEFEQGVREVSVSRIAQEEMNKAVALAKVSEAEVKKHYDDNKTGYSEPASYHLFQISVEDKEKAAKIKQELDGGKSFLEIAKKESVDDFKDAGGDRGFVVEKAIEIPVMAVLKQLKKDEISAPVQVDENLYLLVKYVEKKPGKVKEYDQVAAQITRELESEKQREAYEGEIDRLKKDLNFKLDDKSVELFKKESLSKEDKEKTLFSYAGKNVKVQELDEELQQIPPFLRPQILGGKGLFDIINNFSARKLALENAEQNYDKLSKEYAELINDSRRRMVIKKLLDEQLGTVSVSDKEIEEYYNKNLAKFSSEAQMNAHHILVKDEEEAKKILEELKKAPEKFEAIAREKSTCPSGKANGGDLGMFGEGQMVAEFDEACKTAKIGEITGPVKTQFGYHIIRVNKRSPAGTKKLEEVKEEIKKTLLPEKQKNAFTEFVDEVKKEFDVKVYEDKL
jgi:peptidyl-prolyl cis-trans isomerase C